MAVVTEMILLSGIVGSQAYGLATEDSDVDRLGVYAAPTVEFFGLDSPQETRVTTNPDITMHEAGKYCRLALQCNPTILELMWLPAEWIEGQNYLGNRLCMIRSGFLSAKRVRDAYLGYATQQFKRLKDRGDGSFSADTRKRTAKHARHLTRLLQQGSGLYLTGELSIELEDPEFVMDFGNRVAAGDLEVAEDAIRVTENVFDTRRTPLPAQPCFPAVQDWLRQVRYHYLEV